jgi:sugar phosphate isomerase/epimerase
MIYISSSCIKHSDILESIKALSTITKNIELSGGSAYKDNLLDSLLSIKKEYDLNYLVHSYFPPPAKDFVLNFADTGDTTREFITESMRYIDALDIEYYSVHAGFKRDFKIKDERLFDGTDEFEEANIYKNIDWFYTNFNKKLALENLYPNKKNDTCYANSIDEIISILDHDKRVYLLLDLGHLKVSSRYYGFDYLDSVKRLFEEYGDRVLELHISENSGEDDDHSIIYSDSVQYFIVDKYKEIIKDKINITIEARVNDTDLLLHSYKIFDKILR